MTTFRITTRDAVRRLVRAAAFVVRVATTTIKAMYVYLVIVASKLAP